MDNLNDIHYSDEARKLFKTTPPLLIRLGHLLVGLFVFALVIAGFSLRVPYQYTATIRKAGDGIFLIENKAQITKGQSLEITLPDEKKITISSCRIVYQDGISYIQFTPERTDSLLFNDFGDVGECGVQYTASLTDSYFKYLLHGK